MLGKAVILDTKMVIKKIILKLNFIFIFEFDNLFIFLIKFTY